MVRGKTFSALDLREVGHDVLGDAVPQVFVLLHSREVLEVEDGDRAFGPPSRRLRVGDRRGSRGARAAAVELAPQPEEVRLELRRGLVAKAPVLLERLLQDRPERGRHRRVRVHDRPRIAIQDGIEDHGLRVALERATAGGHLIEDRAEREEVGARIGRQPARLLRRHVVDRAEHGPHRRQVSPRGRRGAGRLSAGLVVLELRESEVEDLHLAAGGDHHVHRLQVAMDDALRVRGLERIGHLDAQLHERPDFHRPRGEPGR